MKSDTPTIISVGTHHSRGTRRGESCPLPMSYSLFVFPIPMYGFLTHFYISIKRKNLHKINSDLGLFSDANNDLGLCSYNFEVSCVCDEPISPDKKMTIFLNQIQRRRVPGKLHKKLTLRGGGLQKDQWQQHS